MPLHVLEHALGAHILAQLRDETTPPERFRTLTCSLTQLLVTEATRQLPTLAMTIRTPLEETPGQKLEHTPTLVPVLRAGLGMLDAALVLLPEATVGYVGLARDEQTAIATAYYSKLPPLEGRVALLLDPMLATGGSAAWAANHLYMAGAADVRLLCVVAAPEGVARLEESFPRLSIFTAALDRELNDRSYILPGLGDFGDRLYGTFVSI
jgi:uracil phosphoribosyltransferase